MKWLRVCAVLVPLAFVSVSQAEEKSRPNVLFIMADDLNNSLGCYQHEYVTSPNIDNLAERGVLFERAYCQYPLCGPSRNSMLTGLYPNSSGILTNSTIFRETIPSHVSLPQAFRQAGYFAARIGKLYHYNVPKSIGTNGHDDPGSWEMELNPAGVDRLVEEPDIFTLREGNFGGTLSWYASPRPGEEHTDGLQAIDAEWVLERCANSKRPFFLAVGFFRPHTPYVSPEKYFEKYPADTMPVVQGVEEDQQDIPRAGLLSHKKEHEKLTDPLRRECRQAYYASISFMDQQVGKVMAALKRLKLDENTIVVFTSDHGYHMGEHGLWQKMSLFEESARVPLIISAPGVGKTGTRPATPVGLIDLYPTLCEMCDVDAPSNLQGQSLVPMLKDPEAVGRGWTLTQVVRGSPPNRPSKRTGFFGYTLRTPQWRYTEWDDGEQGRELYDHQKDPHELTNLAEDPNYRETVEKLSAQVRKVAKSTYPESGKLPEFHDKNWAPNLTNP